MLGSRRAAIVRGVELKRGGARVERRWSRDVLVIIATVPLPLGFATT